MKNRKSIHSIVAFSLFVGGLHFVAGPDYNGVAKEFVRGYLIDLLLPMNMYLLLQLALRKQVKTVHARIIAAVAVFTFGVFVEFMQLYHFRFLGSTYDPMDIAMYATGVVGGIIADLTIIDYFEKKKAG
jgi:hypothetical protein